MTLNLKSSHNAGNILVPSFLAVFLEKNIILKYMQNNNFIYKEKYWVLYLSYLYFVFSHSKKKHFRNYIGYIPKLSKKVSRWICNFPYDWIENSCSPSLCCCAYIYIILSILPICMSDLIMDVCNVPPTF